jgi:hypothetical protein
MSIDFKKRIIGTITINNTGNTSDKVKQYYILDTINCPIAVVDKNMTLMSFAIDKTHLKNEITGTKMCKSMLEIYAINYIHIEFFESGEVALDILKLLRMFARKHKEVNIYIQLDYNNETDINYYTEKLFKKENN